MTRQEESVFTVLFVCTGNICRSALAERMARAYLDEALGGDAHRIRTVSAGTHAVVGASMHPDSAIVLGGFGGDPAAHVARQLVEVLAADADLVLGMTRDHRRAVLVLAPRALQRTFTLKEAAALLADVGPRTELHGEDLAERCRSLVRRLAAARARRTSEGADDVVDPIGRPLEVHEDVAEVVAESLVPVLSRLVGLRDDPGERGGAPRSALVG